MDHRTELRQARKHVRIGQRCIARQRATLERLRRDGHPTGKAERMLELFEEAQRLHVWSVQQVTSEIRGEARKKRAG